LLRALDALEHGEPRRHAEVTMSRWNKLTEHFQALISRFGNEAPGPVHDAAERLSSLSTAFTAARGQNVLFEQDKILAAAEKALLETLTQIRSARPRDCVFQANVVSTVTR